MAEVAGRVDAVGEAAATAAAVRVQATCRGARSRAETTPRLDEAKATKAAERSLVGAASGGKGVPVESTSAEKSGRKHKVSSKPAARPAKARKASSSDVAQAV